jgi:hypothetical protein
MSVLFDSAMYSDLTWWASPWLAEPHLESYRLSLSGIPDVAKAVYIAFSCDGVVRYVGSVARSGPALRSRFRDHLTNRVDSRYWTHLWVVEFKSDTPVSVVRCLEGIIGRTLNPTDNHRLPVAV